MVLLPVSPAENAGDLMIFALATDDRSLMAFATEAEATAYCEGVDGPRAQ